MPARGLGAGHSGAELGAMSLLPFKSACSAVASSTCSLLKVHAVAQTDTAYSIGLEESHQSSTFNGDRAAHAGAALQHIQVSYNY